MSSATFIPEWRESSCKILSPARQPCVKLNFHKVYDLDRYVYAIWQPAERLSRILRFIGGNLWFIWNVRLAKQKGNLQIEMEWKRLQCFFPASQSQAGRCEKSFKIYWVYDLCWRGFFIPRLHKREKENKLDDDADEHKYLYNSLLPDDFPLIQIAAYRSRKQAVPIDMENEFRCC